MPTVSPISPTLAPEQPATAGLVRSPLAAFLHVRHHDYPVWQALIIPGIIFAIALTSRQLDRSLESLGSCSSLYCADALLFAVLLFVNISWLTTVFPKSQA